MDAFFASIEQHDNEKLRGKPVIVGGNPWGRSVVSTCSYEAREFGVRSGMPCRRAAELCPMGVFIPCRMAHYATVSRDIFNIFHKVTPTVEPLSVDEAFLDVTQNALHCQSAVQVARELQRNVAIEVGLSCSIGISYNQFLAKVASGLRKPNGLTVILPEEAEKFLETLPIREFYGIGRATAERLEARQVFTGADLKALSLATLTELFGKVGRHYYNIVRGRDFRRVEPPGPRKSLGKECTFEEDLRDISEAVAELKKIASAVSAALRLNNLHGRCLTLKVRYNNFESITRSCSLPQPTCDEELIAFTSERLLRERTEVAVRRIRLLGISLSQFAEQSCEIAKPLELRQIELPLIF
jgi:DNA polymerase-4